MLISLPTRDWPNDFHCIFLTFRFNFSLVSDLIHFNFSLVSDTFDAFFLQKSEWTIPGRERIQK